MRRTGFTSDPSISEALTDDVRGNVFEAKSIMFQVGARRKATNRVEILKAARVYRFLQRAARA
jgi:hypothetical protein